MDSNLLQSILTVGSWAKSHTLLGHPRDPLMVRLPASIPDYSHGFQWEKSQTTKLPGKVIAVNPTDSNGGEILSRILVDAQVVIWLPVQATKSSIRV